MDLALNNLQRLICHKTQQTKPNQNYMIRIINTYEKDLAFNNLQWLICQKTKPKQTKISVKSAVAGNQGNISAIFFCFIFLSFFLYLYNYLLLSKIIKKISIL